MLYLHHIYIFILLFLGSSDILSMKTVQQLSTSLHLRLLSLLNEKNKRNPPFNTTGSLIDNDNKLYSALYAALSLEKLQQQEINNDFKEINSSNVYNIIVECIAIKIPKEFKFSGNKVAEIIFNLAVNASIKQNYYNTTNTPSNITNNSDNSIDSSSSIIISGSCNHDEKLHSKLSVQGGKGLMSSNNKTFPTSLDIWTPLIDLLAYLDSSGSNWLLHQVAIEGVLYLQILPYIPLVLVKSYSNCHGDIAVLLRVLLSKGQLSEACYLAATFISEHTHDNMNITNSSNNINSIDSNSNNNNIIMESSQKSQTVPYTVIDEIIIATKKYFLLYENKFFSKELKENQKLIYLKLKSDFLLLEKNLEKYFTMVLAMEMK